MFRNLKGRYQDLVAEYGAVALGIWFGLAAVVFLGFTVAIRMGVSVEGAAGSAGTFGAAYVGLQLTKPVRIVATLALTPFVGQWVHRRRASAVDPLQERPDAVAVGDDSDQAVAVDDEQAVHVDQQA